MTADQSAPSAPAERRCTACGTVKPLDCFHKNRANKDGLQHACKPCQIAFNSTPTARAGNRERMRKARLDPAFRAKENARERQRYAGKRAAQAIA